MGCLDMRSTADFGWILMKNMSFFGGCNVLRVGIRSLSLFGLVEF